MNKKGFTLIEIIVGIAIGSILLAVAGSMIVSSYKTVYDTTDTDMDKRVVDSAAEVVRTDTQFCFDVRLVSEGSTDVPDVEHEEGWHWIYVKDGQLYRDDQLLFDSSYYNNKSIKIKANIFVKNDVRVDFNYYLVDRNGKDVYSTRDTLLYLNIQADNLHKGIYNAENAVELSNDDMNGNTDNTKYRLYYRNVMSEVIVPDPNPDPEPIPPEEEKTEKDYTVSDGLVTEGNYVETYTTNGDHKSYRYGSVVYYKGAYWQLVKPENANTEPGKSTGNAENLGWRKLDTIYDQNSCYLANDVVLYNGVYYRAKVDVSDRVLPNKSTNWEVIGNESDTNILKILEKNYKKYPIHKIEPYIRTVQDVYWPKDTKFIEVHSCTPDNCKFSPYQASKQYSVGSYVIDQNNNLYYKGFQGERLAPGNASSGWIKLSLYYDANSSYLKDDIIAGVKKGNTALTYFKALQKITIDHSMTLSGYWEEYTLQESN